MESFNVGVNRVGQNWTHREPDAVKCWEQLVRYTGVQSSQQQVCTYFPLCAEIKQEKKHHYYYL